MIITIMIIMIIAVRNTVIVMITIVVAPGSLRNPNLDKVTFDTGILDVRAPSGARAGAARGAWANVCIYIYIYMYMYILDHMYIYIYIHVYI